PVAAAPAPVAPSPARSLAAPHRSRAVALEREGSLRRALDEGKIALTIDPGDAAAPARKRAPGARVGEAVAARLRQGRDALARGVQLEARRHFLAVLAIDPANRVAFEALSSEVREVRSVLHTVRRGETLASIAERYYGDRSRGEVIGASNRLTADAHLGIGTSLKVPEIPGLPLRPPELRHPAAPVDS